ncbi:MAG: HAMP domain-containing histidine kinase [Planctomycetes bacterium]|nr:HAMP domain-containing histidine kinase [Planctomycetota bacterium]
MDGKKQLALVRSVSVEHSQFCTLQGVLLDWEGLRKRLEEEALDIPGLRLEPVEIGTPFDLNTMHDPRAIGCIAADVGRVFSDLAGLIWVLALTWCATILALFAICYGTMKYVGMLERRMQFVAAVTHELRTPLTAFQIYTDLLADLGDDPGRRTQYVETLRRESKRLSRLVENVLVYSKIGDARPHLNKASVTPRFVLDAVALQMKEPCLAAGKQIVVEDRCDDRHTIDTDTEFVIQILANLLENACKYSSTASDPRIWLTAAPWGENGVAFEVEDLGVGIAASDRRAIFKPFRRGATAQDGGKTGMGLGLALSRYWATCLGGRLDLKRGEHNGAHYTRFSLCLPGLK